MTAFFFFFLIQPGFSKMKMEIAETSPETYSIHTSTSHCTITLTRKSRRQFCDTIRRHLLRNFKSRTENHLRPTISPKLAILPAIPEFEKLQLQPREREEHLESCVYKLRFSSLAQIQYTDMQGRA